MQASSRRASACQREEFESKFEVVHQFKDITERLTTFLQEGGQADSAISDLEKYLIASENCVDTYGNECRQCKECRESFDKVFFIMLRRWQDIPDSEEKSYILKQIMTFGSPEGDDGNEDILSLQSDAGIYLIIAHIFKYSKTNLFYLMLTIIPQRVIKVIKDFEQSQIRNHDVSTNQPSSEELTGTSQFERPVEQTLLSLIFKNNFDLESIISIVQILICVRNTNVDTKDERINDLFSLLTRMICQEKTAGQMMVVINLYLDLRDKNVKLVHPVNEFDEKLNSYHLVTNGFYGENKDYSKDNEMYYLMKKSLLGPEPETSLLFMAQLDDIVFGALAAYAVMKRKQSESKFGSKQYKQYKMLKKFYQEQAIEVLQLWEKKGTYQTQSVLLQPKAEVNNNCNVIIAVKTENKKFLSHESCQDLNDTILNQYVRKTFTTNYLRNWFKIKLSKRMVPSILFLLDFISFFFFWVLYGLLLVSLLKASSFHGLEVYILLFILFYTVEEFNQMRCLGLRNYWKDIFNKIDVFAIICYLIAFCLRLIALSNQENQGWMITARVVFSLDYVIFSIKMLEHFYAFKDLGPIWIMITGMIQVILQFLLILMVFFMAYVVSSESLLYPESEFSIEFLFYLFRKGFWAMFGEFSLEEIEDNECRTNSTTENKYDGIKCTTVIGKYVVPILLGIYTVFVQILLFNLLIALFNSTITKTEKRRSVLWQFQRFQLTLKYTTNILPNLPFTFLFFALFRSRISPYLLSPDDFYWSFSVDEKCKREIAQEFLKKLDGFIKVFRAGKVQEAEKEWERKYDKYISGAYTESIANKNEDTELSAMSTDAMPNTI